MGLWSSVLCMYMYATKMYVLNISQYLKSAHICKALNIMTARAIAKQEAACHRPVGYIPWWLGIQSIH